VAVNNKQTRLIRVLSERRKYLNDQQTCKTQFAKKKLLNMGEVVDELLTSDGDFKHKVSSILNGSSDYASKVGND
jgi:hypothetical protein